jgi:hypothetical protein
VTSGSNVEAANQSYDQGRCHMSKGVVTTAGVVRSPRSSAAAPGMRAAVRQESSAASAGEVKQVQKL